MRTSGLPGRSFLILAKKSWMVISMTKDILLPISLERLEERYAGPSPPSRAPVEHTYLFGHFHTKNSLFLGKGLGVEMT